MHKIRLSPSPTESDLLGVEPPFKITGVGQGTGWEWAQALIWGYLRS